MPHGGSNGLPNRIKIDKSWEKCSPGRVLGEVLRIWSENVDIWSLPNPQEWAIAREGARSPWIAMSLKSYPKWLQNVSNWMPPGTKMLPKPRPGRFCDARENCVVFLVTFRLKRYPKMEPQNQIFWSFSGSRLKGVPKRSQGSILGSFWMYFGDILGAVLEVFLIDVGVFFVLMWEVF